MHKVASSFRDPSGFVFFEENTLYRGVTKAYSQHYTHLMSSGLYDELVKKTMLVAHKEVEHTATDFKTLLPEKIPFISYPYEWSFSQLKDAALLTLKIQKCALKHGMTLKDASAYNVQFNNGKPIFIDTLSFEKYESGTPWVAYKQFCQHFLAPLALMSYTDIQLNKLFRVFIDGIPLNLAAKLLPFKTYFKLPLLLHIHLHARAQKKYEDSALAKKSSISANAMLGLIDNLETGVKKLTWKAGGTEWADYYNGDSYTQQGFEDKKTIVRDFLALAQPQTVWDLGANDGVYSRIAAESTARVISYDIDPACVENNYNEIKKHGEHAILPLILDLTNPSAGIGWGNTERTTIAQRGPTDMVMALALVHHLAISNNIPLEYIAQYLSKLTTWLIIEFVPKTDKKVQKLLASRADIFDNYTQKGFETAFSGSFEIHTSVKIKDSERTLYLMKKITKK